MFRDQDSQSHKVQRVFLFYIRDFPKKKKKKNLWTVPTLADHINSWPWNKMHNPSQKSLSQDLLPDLFLMLGTILGRPGRSAEPFCHSHRGFPAPFPRPIKTACVISVFVCVVGLFYLSCTYSIGLKSSLYCLPGWITHKKKRMCPWFFTWWWATHSSLE